MDATSILTKHSVPVDIDGTEFRLCYRAFAFIRYAEETGGDLLGDIQGAVPLAEEMRQGKVLSAKLFTLTRNFLWAGLIESSPDLTLVDVSHMFGLPDIVP